MNNFIIDFTPEAERFRKESLTNKLLNKSESVNYIRITQKEVDEGLTPAQIEFLNRIDNLSRVYIIDHGSPNSPRIHTGHYQDIADLIGQNIRDVNLHNPNSTLKISLIPCFSGRGEHSGLESFAGLFHRYLGQNYHIYSEVLARNELVWTHGEKSTATTLDYIMLNLAQEIGITSTQASTENILSHQRPGTKISLVWDANGDEWVVDAYIDKYFSLVAMIIAELENTATLPLSKNNAELLASTLSYLKSCLKSKAQETYGWVKSMDSALTRLQAGLKNKNALLNEYIQEALSLSEHSIDETSIVPKNSHINITSPSKEKEENIKQKVEEQITSPILTLLDRFPKTPKEQALKQEATAFMQLLSSIATTKLKREQNYRPERNMNRYMENILLHLLENDIPKEQQIKNIVKMKNAIADELVEQIIGWPEMTGGIQGVQAANKAGGWIGLKNLFPLISKRSAEKTQDVKLITEKLNTLIESCLNYLEGS